MMKNGIFDVQGISMSKLFVIAISLATIGTVLWLLVTALLGNGHFANVLMNCFPYLVHYSKGGT